MFRTRNRGAEHCFQGVYDNARNVELTLVRYKKTSWTSNPIDILLPTNKLLPTNETVEIFLFNFVKIIPLESTNCALTLRKRLFRDAKPMLLRWKTAAFGTQNDRFYNTL